MMNYSQIKINEWLNEMFLILTVCVKGSPLPIGLPLNVSNKYTTETNVNKLV